MRSAAESSRVSRSRVPTMSLPEGYISECTIGEDYALVFYALADKDRRGIDALSPTEPSTAAPTPTLQRSPTLRGEARYDAATPSWHSTVSPSPWPRSATADSLSISRTYPQALGADTPGLGEDPPLAQRLLAQAYHKAVASLCPDCPLDDYLFLTLFHSASPPSTAQACGGSLRGASGDSHTVQPPARPRTTPAAPRPRPKLAAAGAATPQEWLPGTAEIWFSSGQGFGGSTCSTSPPASRAAAGSMGRGGSDSGMEDCVGVLQDQARLRQQFLQNLRAAQDRDATTGKHKALSKEYHHAAKKMHVERQCRQQERAWEANRLSQEARRQRKVGKRSDVAQHLQYGRIRVSTLPAAIASRPWKLAHRPRELQRGSASAAGEVAPDEFLKAYSQAVGRQTLCPVDMWEQKRHERLQERLLKNLTLLPHEEGDDEKAVEAEAEQEDGDFGDEGPPRKRRSLMQELRKASRMFKSEDLHGLEPGNEGDSLDGSLGSGDDVDEPKSISNDRSPKRRTSTGGSWSVYQRGSVTMQGLDELRSFLEEREGSSLIAWVKHFDLNGDLKVSREEFQAGLKSMGVDCNENMMSLFDELDVDGNGELGLEEIDKGQAKIWQEFRHWVTDKYENADALVSGLLGSKDTRIGVEDFSESLLHEGWRRGCEALIFASLDIESAGTIGAWNFRWFELEKKRARLRERAQLNLSENTAKLRSSMKMAAHSDLAEFKAFLQHKYGSFVRAWRCALTPNDSLVIHKHHFLKACTKLGWNKSDPRALWNAFDKDDSGSATLDELDFDAARSLALFKQWVDECFGSITLAFAALDEDGSKTVKPEEFNNVCATLGFKVPKKDLFHGLDKDGKKGLVLEDIVFLDRWKPLPFLLAERNPQAAEAVKDLLLARYKYGLSAWRQLLDIDGGNRCNWFEFSNAVDKIGFHGDVAGAWRELDSIQAGYITLAAIDPIASEILVSFRNWCDKEFGGVKPAFSVFDVDGSNDISRAEFRQACRMFGFRGDPGRLFSALDVKNSGNLNNSQLAFLDSWERSEDPGPVAALAPMQEKQGAGAAGVKAIGKHLMRRGTTTRVSTAAFGLSASDASAAAMAAAAAGKAHAAMAQNSAAARAGSGCRSTASEPPDVGTLPRAMQPGLKAFNSHKNPWSWPKKGALPAMETVVQTLFDGMPAPQGRVRLPNTAPLANAMPRETARSLEAALAASSRSRREVTPALPLPVSSWCTGTG
mmetsp:Transcript_9618/g.34218  ORF Transcript_9618/g.34218 Transcript_9618/m.34218 type:complete len:1225 (-) Transcript_9618:251-3925(-)